MTLGYGRKFKWTTASYVLQLHTVSSHRKEKKKKKKRKKKKNKETKFSSEVHFRKGYVWYSKNYGKDDMTHFTGYVAELKENFARITEARST